jgi:protein-disulfide isomerase
VTTSAAFANGVPRDRARRAGVRRGLGFAFRHFPPTDIHPHAPAAAASAEATAAQGRCWETHDLLFQRQNELEDDDLRRHGEQLVLDVARFDRDRAGGNVIDGIRRDVESALATGQVQGTPTLFIDGLVWRGSDDASTLIGALGR